MGKNKETFYFPHDFNAKSDPKIKKLLLKYSWKGYGIYWSLIEDLYNNANALPLHYDSMAYDLRESIEIIEDIILNFELFVVKNNILSSKSVGRRLKKRAEKSQKAKQSAEKRWNKNNANALPLHSDCNAVKESKVNESKEKEKKENKSVVVEENIQQQIFKFFEINKQDTFEVEKFLDFNKDKKLHSGNWENYAKRWIRKIKGFENHAFLSSFEIMVNEQIDELKTEEGWKAYKTLLYNQDIYKKLSKDEKARIEKRLSSAWTFRIALNL